MRAAPPVLDRAIIRARLAAAQTQVGRASGDVATAHRLMAEGALETYERDRFGVIPSSGIPYERGAGAPGVKVKTTPAAVLVPLIEHADGTTVLLTLRNADLKKHAGQVAFPGGRMEPDDADAVACALREAQEETGIDPAGVEILGQLSPYLTITGFEVTPVVGAIVPPVALTPDPLEVAAVFEVPLAFFLDPANHHRETREYNGQTRAYYAMPYGDRYIWGATAGMLLNLYDALVPAQAAEAG
jgi:8-oxo-dGTP pyrophosphatase MutT (NUDIX family)